MVKVLGSLTLAQVLPAALQFASMVLVLLVLTGPRPFSSTGVSLFRIEAQMIRPSNGSSTSNVTIDGLNATSFILPTSTANFSTASISIVSTSTLTTLPGPTVSSSSLSPTVPTPTALPGSAGTVPSPGSPAVSAAVSSSGPTSTPPPPPPLRRRSDLVPPRPLAHRETANLTTAGLIGAPLVSETSNVELIFGPLGSCFISAAKKQECTGSYLQPAFNSTGISSTSVGFSTIGLPETLDKTPPLLLASLCILILSVSSHIPSLLASSNPAKFGHLLDSGPRQRYYARVQSLMVWVVVSAFLILLGSGVRLRIVFAKAMTAFNASNSELGRLLPAEATVSGRGRDVTLVAKLGSGFALIWASVGMSLLSIILERKRLRRAQALAEAKGDLEARYGREALEKAGVSSISAAPQPSSTDASPGTSKETLTTIYVPKSSKPYYASFVKDSSASLHGSVRHIATPTEPPSVALRSASRASDRRAPSRMADEGSYESSIHIPSRSASRSQHYIAAPHPPQRPTSPMSAYDYYVCGVPPGSSSSDVEASNSGGGPRRKASLRSVSVEETEQMRARGAWRKKPQRWASEASEHDARGGQHQVRQDTFPPRAASSRSLHRLHRAPSSNSKAEYWTHEPATTRSESEYDYAESVVSHGHGHGDGHGGGSGSRTSIASSTTLYNATSSFSPKSKAKEEVYLHGSSSSSSLRDVAVAVGSAQGSGVNAIGDGQPTMTTLLLSSEMTRKREILRAMLLKHGLSEEERERRRVMESREMMRFRAEMERRCRARDGEE